MTRLVRLTRILLALQSRRILTSQELSEKFCISQRTVYRDIKTLEEAGVPVSGEPGVGYSLREDYRMPPLMFTQNEVNALLTAQKLVQKNADASLINDLDEIVQKVKAILRTTARDNTELLEDRIRVHAAKNDHSTRLLADIQLSIINRNLLKINYRTINDGVITNRTIEPLAVYFTRQNWVLIAFCRLRQAMREFRLDGILELIILQEFHTTTAFSFEKYIESIKNLPPADIPLS